MIYIAKNRKLVALSESFTERNKADCLENAEQSKKTTILKAAIECVNRWGVDRFSMADLAKEAKVARSTVYMYYNTRDEVIRDALLQSAVIFGEKLIAYQSQFFTPQERLIETFVFGINQLPKEPFLQMVSGSELFDMVSEHTLTTPEGLNIGAALIASILDKQGSPQAELEEIAELVIRVGLSLITMDSPSIHSDDDLRGFVARRILPALGFPVPEQYCFTVIKPL